jgi:hypothetical protein
MSRIICLDIEEISAKREAEKKNTEQDKKHNQGKKK